MRNTLSGHLVYLILWLEECVRYAISRVVLRKKVDEESENIKGPVAKCDLSLRTSPQTGVAIRFYAVLATDSHAGVRTGSE